MQFYKYDKVIINDGILDDNGVNIGGTKGHIDDIGSRNSDLPITVSILNPLTGLYANYHFEASELTLDKTGE